MVDDRTIAEYADEGHTGPHLPCLVPDVEEPMPAAAAPMPPGTASINSQLPTTNWQPPTINSSPRKRRRKSGGALNAAKHGIFVYTTSGTDLRRLKRLIVRFARELQPVGPIEETLVEKIAFTCLRLQRCALAESLYHEGIFRTEPGRQIRGIEDVFNSASFEKTATLINRYDTSLTNHLTKLLRELSRLQEARLKKSAAPLPFHSVEGGFLNRPRPAVASIPSKALPLSDFDNIVGLADNPAAPPAAAEGSNPSPDPQAEARAPSSPEKA